MLVRRITHRRCVVTREASQNVLKRLDTVPFMRCMAHVKLESTAWNGVNTAVAAPTTLTEADYPISNGQLIVKSAT